ncbi:MAG: ketoacyl-ACP synthase III [Rickettsiales bacterium]|jgi:3-oxoacyl-[acyl-carrier-protein] synthase-3|nr:ketoacyl-ACP synthase III [Rickettsiales bacterium]
MPNSKIIATGSYLPRKIYDNRYMESIVDTSDQWIVERTGIRERHIASENELTTDLALEAVLRLFKTSGISRTLVDTIIFATTTPDRTFPSCASILQGKLGLANDCPAFDVQAVCCGFIYAIDLADSLIKTNKARNVLVIGAETMSKLVNWEDRNTCILFGDGAGATLLSATEEDRGILATSLHSDGNYVDLLKTSGGVSTNREAGFIEMQGKEVFKLAVNNMYSCILESLGKCGLMVGDIDFLIPHQANQRIIDGLSRKLNIAKEKIVSTVAFQGNTSAASIPMAIDYALNGYFDIKKDSLVVLESVGGGLTWGSIVMRW